MKSSRIVGMVASLLLLLASLVSNFLQGRRIYLLQAEIERLSVQGELPIGTVVPALPVRDLSGQPFAIEYMGKPTILYVFQPFCQWCIRNGDGLKSLAAQVSDRYTLVGLSLSDEGLIDFIQAHDMHFPVFTGISDVSRGEYRHGPTPETLVIAPGGRVMQTWKGAFEGTTKSLVERFFSIHLPSPEQVGPGEHSSTVVPPHRSQYMPALIGLNRRHTP